MFIKCIFITFISFLILSYCGGTQENSEELASEALTLNSISGLNSSAEDNSSKSEASCPTITTLTSSNVTQSSATLSWAKNEKASSYIINYKIVGDLAWTSVSSNELSYSLTGLNSGRDYEWQIKSNCSDVISSTSSTATFTTQTVSSGGGAVITCATPSGISSFNVTQTSADLTWGTIGSATNYNVQYRVVGAGSWTNSNFSSTVITLNSLSNSTNYEFQIQANCSGTLSSFSSVFTFTTQSSGSTCGTPGGISISGISQTGITLNWGNIGSATTYNINYRVQGAGSWSTTTSSSASKTLSSLVNATNYEWQVQADCSGVLSSYSPVNSFTTLTTCPTPSSLTTASITTNSATLNWGSVAGASGGYNISYRVVGNLSWTTGATLSNSLNINSLTSSSNYEWKVQSDCGSNGTSTDSSIANFTTLTPCNTPTGLSSGSLTTTGATLSWTAVSGASSYSIQYRTTGSTPWNTTSSATNSRALTGLSINTGYDWQVQTTCTSGSSSYTSINTFSTPPQSAFSKLAAGRSTCAVYANGKMNCWGTNTTGSLGYGNINIIGDDETPASAGLISVDNSLDVIDVDTSDDHMCVILTGGSVKCWGNGADGKLGYSNTTHIGDNELPSTIGNVFIGSGITAKKISTGLNHTCIIDNNDDVRCWGYNGNGALGTGNTSVNVGDNETPGSIGIINISGDKAQEIAAGGNHTCIITTANNVKCWGLNNSGQLGYNTTTFKPNANNVGNVNFGASRTAKKIVTGFAHTCIIDDQDKVRCWGNGANGRLGYGNTNTIGDNETPSNAGTVNIGGASNTVTQISAGTAHNCALRTDNSIVCWGMGTDGRLGYGNTNDMGDNEAINTLNVSLVSPPGSVTISTIIAGNTFNFAILSNGEIKGWGDGIDGRLGLGNTNDIGDNELPSTVGYPSIKPSSLGAYLFSWFNNSLFSIFTMVLILMGILFYLFRRKKTQTA